MMHLKDQFLGNVVGGIEFLTASTMLGHLAVNFLPVLGFSTFLLGLFTDPVA